MFFQAVLGCTKTDLPDAIDGYGRSKLLGEISYRPHLTLRTSIIGHELNKSLSLVDWFLKQNGSVRGFKNAIFSGLPTVCVADFLNNYVFGKSLSGLYHLSAKPIDKYSLLKLIKETYSVDIEIIPYDDFFIDRSLDSGKLTVATGFKPLAWRELIKKMREEHLAYFSETTKT